jgi:hypothetical protein
MYFRRSIRRIRDEFCAQLLLPRLSQRLGTGRGRCHGRCHGHCVSAGSTCSCSTQRRVRRRARMGGGHCRRRRDGGGGRAASTAARPFRRVEQVLAHALELLLKGGGSRRDGWSMRRECRERSWRATNNRFLDTRSSLGVPKVACLADHGRDRNRRRRRRAARARASRAAVQVAAGALREHVQVVCQDGPAEKEAQQ